MKKLILIAISAGVALSAVSPAMARDGCGDGWHRGPYGHCHPNGYRGPGPGPVLVAPGFPTIGLFYEGRGYWDGHRYYGHRYPYRGGWRYR